MMTTIEFYKYQGTGNDFVMIDNRDLSFPKQQSIIAQLCDRRFGIGADGLILLETDPETDFKMVYYNADGNESTMCGNGGRCLVAFANFLKVFDGQCTFNAIDGLHEAEINNGLVKLKMIDVENISKDGEDSVLNTGSPHFVKYVEDVEHFEVYQQGKAIRNSEQYRKEGINVNFVETLSDDEIFVRTYERGVEDETYSCGTGATASALTFLQDKNKEMVKVKVLGGNLKIYAEQQGGTFRNIWLEGPAQQVFKGFINI
ncbi:diaminopimelate epimerase [Bergeyella porcorum]|uniref:diaminopimelate epimerase n=1 Tax=Bergeyella porcorum TaxID=1735111 RepID=UPI0035EF386F